MNIHGSDQWLSKQGTLIYNLAIDTLDRKAQRASAPKEASFFVEYPLHIVLVHPEIPHNTGAVGRTCLAVGAKLWLVKPLGFRTDAQSLRRAGLDYWQHVEWETVDHWEGLLARLNPSGWWFFTKRGTRSFWDVSYGRGDALVFGSETAGLPSSLLDRYPDRVLTIPIGSSVRSLNLSCSVAVAAFESLRQLKGQALSS